MALVRKLSKAVRRMFGLTEANDLREKRKAEERKIRFDSVLWERDSQIARRNYGKYDDYIEHQSAKLSRIRHRLDETVEEDLAEFLRRFSLCEELKEARVILCLGARLGTEVRALLQLRYFAVGVDLNPGSGNQYVLSGDFHHLVFPDASVDAVYTNSLDHAFDLERVVREVRRVLRPGGLFVIDLVRGFDEGFVPGEFEALHWARADGLIDRICAIGEFQRTGARDLGHHRRDEWLQRVLQKKMV